MSTLKGKQSQNKKVINIVYYVFYWTREYSFKFKLD